MSTRLALLSLAMGSFAVGCTEFAVVALIPSLAADLDVTIGAAGQLVTVNAVSVVVGAPLLGAATARVPPRTALALTLTAFAAAHLAAAGAPSFWWVFTTRVVSGLTFGLFLSTAFAAAAGLVRAGERGRALAVAQSGITASTALGLPASLLISHARGDAGWRASFVVMALVALAAAALVLRHVPRTLPHPPVRDPGFRERLAVVRHPGVALGLVAVATFWAGSFGALTYLLPYLQEELGWGVGLVTVVLAVAGGLSLAGNTLGGRVAHSAPAGGLVVTSVAALCGLVVVFAVPPSAGILVLSGVVVWQLAAWTFVPIIQTRVHALGEDRGDAAVSFAVAAFNVGILTGAGLCGMAVDVTGFAGVLAVAAVLGTSAVCSVLLVNRFLSEHSSRDETAGAVRDNP